MSRQQEARCPVNPAMDDRKIDSNATFLEDAISIEFPASSFDTGCASANDSEEISDCALEIG